MNKLTVVISVCLVVIVAAGVVMLIPPQTANAPTPEPQDTEEPQAPEDKGNAAEKAHLIKATSPQPNTKITSPIVIVGEARGTWYFEASFPIEVRDAAGNVIGQGYAQAQGEWMTTEFVPFESISITFSAQPAGSQGSLVLKKDNPSGLPEHDDELIVPIMF